MDTVIEVGAVAPVTFALVVALRQAGLPDRFTPLVAICVGVAVALVAAAGGLVDLGMVPAGFGGVLAGAAATGGHQAVKQTRRPGP